MQEYGTSLFREFFRVIKKINDQNLKYAIIGGIAMAFHERPRFTRDIDILIYPNDIDVIKKLLKALGYFESSPPWTFKNTNLTLHRFMKVIHKDEIMIDVLLANSIEHQKIIEDTITDDSYVGKVRIADRKYMIILKQARNSAQDQVDIRSLQDDKN
jgi:predicted nucleotidyltransferase